MRKSVKITIAVLSVLLCTVLISTAVLSGTFSKYSTSVEGFSEGARVAKWGINASTRKNDLGNAYYKDDVLVVEAKSADADLIAPGTSGSLVAFRVNGSAEVSYKVDFSGRAPAEGTAFSCGNGYYADSYLIRNANGTSAEYFPIVIGFYKTEVTTDSQGKLIYDPAKRVKIKTFGLTGTHADGQYDTLSALVAAISDDNAINTLFDENISPNTAKDTIYTVEWEWPATAPAGNTYQKQELDTALGEALAKDPTAFAITIDMILSVYQTQS